MRRIIAAVALVAGLVLAAGCDPQSPPERGPVKTSSPSAASPQQRIEAIKALCDFFAVRPLEVLGTPGAEGNVTLLAQQPGVPPSLATRAVAYYDGGYGGKPDTDARRREQDRRYTELLSACRQAGSGWRRP